MATHTGEDHNGSEDRELWLVGELRRLITEDNFAGASPAVDRYPHLTRHTISEFERDLRDWGLAYGVAFGLAVSKWPETPHEELAQTAFHAARMSYVSWAGEIQDPAMRREAAISAVVEKYDEWDEARYRDRSGSSEAPMGGSMSSALHELREAVA